MFFHIMFMYNFSLIQLDYKFGIKKNHIVLTPVNTFLNKRLENELSRHN